MITAIHACYTYLTKSSFHDSIQSNRNRTHGHAIDDCMSMWIREFAISFLIEISSTFAELQSVLKGGVETKVKVCEVRTEYKRSDAKRNGIFNVNCYTVSFLRGHTRSGGLGLMLDA
eukprot:4597364-Pyramimonas_sp.AAC.1